MGGVISRSRCLGWFLLAAVAGGACGPRTPVARSAASLWAVDDAGDTVRLAAPARRIVSLIPATSELLYALGAGDRVVGRTTWCDYPPAIAAVPVMGDGIRPNIELVAAQRPDLVVLYNSGQNADAVARFRELGIASVRVSIDRIDDLLRDARLLGRLTGREAVADSLARAITDSLAAVTVDPEALRPGVFIIVWDSPPMTIGRGSFLHEVVERAGGRNIFGDLAASAGQVSIEAVADRDPDLILTSADGLPRFAGRPEWQVVRAVRERHFLHVRGSAFDPPSPRTPNAIRELSGAMAEAAR